jgi:hypothetical protein
MLKPGRTNRSTPAIGPALLCRPNCIVNSEPDEGVRSSINILQLFTIPVSVMFGWGPSEVSLSDHLSLMIYVRFVQRLLGIFLESLDAALSYGQI